MNKVLLRLQPYAEPAIAVAFFVFWALTEPGTHPIVHGFIRWVLPWWAAFLGICVAMAFARLRPMIAMAISTLIVCGQLVFPFVAALSGGFDWPIYFGFLVVVFGVSAGIDSRWRVVSAVFALGIAVAAAELSIGWGRLDWSGPLVVIGPHTTAIVVNRFLIFGIAIILSATAWFLGFTVRLWRQKASVDASLAATTVELNRAEVDLLMTRERDRIAQDVHDIMAHSLAVIIAQADGARFVSADRPEAVTGSLANIADSARASLTDVRMLIENLVTEPVANSSPTLANIDELVERMQQSGLDVDLDRFGEPAELTSAQELAAYRIVQESLTNALKHAGSDAHARVAFDWRGPGLALSVSSRGTLSAEDGQESNAEPQRARGLYGMRERARLAGGWAKAAPDDEDPGRYLVTAFIPTTGVAVAS